MGNTVRQSSQFNTRELSSEEKGISCQGFVDGDQFIGSEYAGSSLGFWSRSIWIPCLDGKARRCPKPGVLGLADGVPVDMDLGGAESGFPLCEKIPNRVMLLRGYGNAINPYVAAEFIKAYLNTIADIENQEGTNAKI